MRNRELLKTGYKAPFVSYKRKPFKIGNAVYINQNARLLFPHPLSNYLSGVWDVGPGMSWGMVVTTTDCYYNLLKHLIRVKNERIK